MWKGGHAKRMVGGVVVFGDWRWMCVMWPSRAYVEHSIRIHPMLRPYILVHSWYCEEHPIWKEPASKCNSLVPKRRNPKSDRQTRMPLFLYLCTANNAHEYAWCSADMYGMLYAKVSSAWAALDISHRQMVWPTHFYLKLQQQLYEVYSRCSRRDSCNLLCHANYYAAQVT